MQDTSRIRNIAIIAHIDHGKTTLIDSVFRSAQVFRSNARVEERVMDSNEIERERGITIRAKHCTVTWGGYHINIIDTPGHADFSGEVERVLATVDSVLLLVDANEGPMPQTRYVLMHALRMGLKPIVFVNKVDRPTADPVGALEKTFDLFIELGATDEQTDFPVLYGSGLDGWSVRDLEKDDRNSGMKSLFETIIEYVPAPDVSLEAPFLMQVSTIAWSDYTGRIGCGKILNGMIHKGETFVRTSTQWTNKDRSLGAFEVTSTEEAKATQIWVTRGLDRVEVEEAFAGDIIWISGPKDISIGDTFAAAEQETILAPLDIEEPTVSMFFLVNTGPFAGQEGQAATLRQIKARLEREAQANVALRVEDLGRPDGIKVSGRGELHLAILIEEMRREGLEFCVSKPEVITEERSGQTYEPFEQLILDIPEDCQGIIFEKLSRRKARIRTMTNLQTGLIRLEFEIPTRGLIGYRGDFLTDTRGLGIMSSCLTGYAPWAGEITGRGRGAMVSMETGDATSYQLENLQERGTLFLSSTDPVYNGMIVGEHCRPGDLPCNPTKKKHVTNHRSSTKDMAVKLDVPLKMTLERALEWIEDDELVEVTPRSIRLRKAILDYEERRKSSRKTA